LIEARRRQHLRRARGVSAAGLDDEVLAAFGIEPRIPPQLQSWHVITNGWRIPKCRDHRHRRQYTGMKGRLQSLIEAFRTAASQQGQGQPRLDRERSVRERGPAPFLEHSTAFWCPADSASVREGKIRRRSSRASATCRIFGICFGMQMAVIEAARNLVGIEEANSTEFGPRPNRWSPDDGMAARQRAREAIEGRRSRRHHAPGGLPAVLKRGSRVSEVYGGTTKFRSVTATLRGQHRLTRIGSSSTACDFPGLSPDGVLPEIVEYEDILVHRSAIPSRAEIAPFRTASVLRRH